MEIQYEYKRPASPRLPLRNVATVDSYEWSTKLPPYKKSWSPGKESVPFNKTIFSLTINLPRRFRYKYKQNFQPKKPVLDMNCLVTVFVCSLNDNNNQNQSIYTLSKTTNFKSNLTNKVDRVYM